MPMARAHILVSGRVQGVFFRAYLGEEAEARGVRGWVRNLPDGRVEAVLEGERDSVEEVIAFCGIGPPGARVEEVEVSWEEYRGEYSDFSIRRW